MRVLKPVLMISLVFLSSFAIASEGMWLPLLLEKLNDPAKIAIRDKALAVIDGFMRQDEQIKIQYAESMLSFQTPGKNGRAKYSD